MATTPTNINPATKSFSVSHSTKITASSKRHHLPLKRSWKARRPLITISTSDSRWRGNWTSEYLLSLQDLRLQDLVDYREEEEEQEHKSSLVSINLSIQKHASFGFSVDGKISTSFTRKCCVCSSPYCKEINTGFKVWVLLSSKDIGREAQLPDIGGDDPSVIYVKPGYEAELDSLIQDTIRLTTSVKDTCSELCEKSEPKLQYIGAQNTASIEKRWSILSKLRK